jgi:hypothetical protein
MLAACSLLSTLWSGVDTRGQLETRDLDPYKSRELDIWIDVTSTEDVYI